MISGGVMETEAALVCPVISMVRAPYEVERAWTGAPLNIHTTQTTVVRKRTRGLPVVAGEPEAGRGGVTSWRCPKPLNVCGSSRPASELYRMANRVRGGDGGSRREVLIPFGVLEERGLEVLLVDPRRLKSVPGRKTDVLDCQWLQQLHTYGLLSGAFRPETEIRVLRSYLRQRAMLVEYAAHHVQHMHKALTQMNIKLQHVISDITGRTGTEIVEAIVGGEREPRKLAKLRDPRIKADEKTIAESLRGHWKQEHIFELTQALELYRVYRAKMEECDSEIELHLRRFEDRSDGGVPADRAGRKYSRGNAPRFDVRTHLYRMTGVDLTAIDGVDSYTALKVVSEVGVDMSRWPTAKHFASWLGLSPNNRVSGGRVMSSRTKPSANRAATALRLSAYALHRSDSALGAFLRRKKAQLGAPKAITATAHKLARIIYSMLKYGQEYVDKGTAYYESQYRQRALSNAKRRAAHLGYRLVPIDGDRDQAMSAAAPVSA